MESMGNKPSPSPLPIAASVAKSKEDNGWKLFQLNLDANADGNGISPWSIVAIILATLLAMWILIRLRRCYKQHIRAKPHSRSIELGPLRYEPAATYPSEMSETVVEEEIITRHPRVASKHPKRP